MTYVQANLLNAAALIGLSLWAYVANGFSSESTLIPVAFGLLLAGHHIWLKSGSRVAFWLVAIYTAIILIALYTPWSSSVAKDDALPILRVSLMMVTSALVLVLMGRSLWATRA